MHWMLAVFVSSVCVPTVLVGQSADRQGLIRQLEASDAIARSLERSSDVTSASTRPASPEAKAPVAYDQLLRETVSGLPVDITVADDLGVLNDYQLRQAIVVLQLNNIQAYVALTHRGDGAPASARLRSEIYDATTQPSRSARLRRYLQNEPEAEALTAQRLRGASAAEDGPGESGQTPSPRDSAATDVLSGRSSSRTFGLPSTVAPLNAKARGSQVIEAVQARTLPMSGDVPRALPLRADPQGNPSEAVPSPEEISRVAAVAGVGFEAAEKLITGELSLTEVMKSRSTPSPQAELIGGLAVHDPRWSTFYYGPKIGVMNWDVDSGAAFTFKSGGGRYESDDRRVNQDFDMRTNGDIDRRVNVIFDRRVDTRIDPRANY